MSWDIYLGCFKGGEFDAIPLSVFEQAFGAYAVERKTEEWVVQYPGGREHEISFSLEDDGGISGFSVNRPPGAEAFWQGLLEVLRGSKSVLYAPGDEDGPAAAVADVAVMAEMPPDMVQTLMPKVVTSLAELWAAMLIVRS